MNGKTSYMRIIEEMDKFLDKFMSRIGELLITSPICET